MIIIRTGDRDVADIEFRLDPETVHGPVCVVGDFNDWDPFANAFTPTDDGSTLVACVTCQPGRSYEFRYLSEVGGWFNDPDVDAYTANEHGGDNCVVTVPAADSASVMVDLSTTESVDRDGTDRSTSDAGTASVTSS